MFKSGLKYSSIAGARAALTAFFRLSGQEVIDNGLIERVMKGAFRLRRPLPKYAFTWDVAVVLKTIVEWGPTKSLSMSLLTYRTVALLALCCPSRVSELASLHLSCMTNQSGRITFVFPELTKTRRQGSPHTVSYASFPSDEQLRPVTTLNTFVQRTLSMRTACDLLLSRD